MSGGDGFCSGISPLASWEDEPGGLQALPAASLLVCIAPTGGLESCGKGAGSGKGKVRLGSVLASPLPFHLIDLRSQSPEPELAEEKQPGCRGRQSSCRPPSLLPVAAEKQPPLVSPPLCLCLAFQHLPPLSLCLLLSASGTDCIGGVLGGAMNTAGSSGAVSQALQHESLLCWSLPGSPALCCWPLWTVSFLGRGARSWTQLLALNTALLEPCREMSLSFVYRG